MGNIVPARGTRDNPTSLEIRFWSKVDRRGLGECWPWLGAIGSDGYGQIWDGTLLPSGAKRVTGAHRIALVLNGSDLSGGMCALHKNECHHKWCVNPDHLYVGTHAENTRDAIGSGTFFFSLKAVQRGEKSPFAKLTDDKVRTIRARRSSGETQAKLAREFGVAQSTISLVVSRKKWGHI